MITHHRCFDEHGQLLLSTPNRELARRRPCARRDTVLFAETLADRAALCELVHVPGARPFFSQRWLRVTFQEHRPGGITA